MSCIEGSLRASATTAEEDAAYKEQRRNAVPVVAHNAIDAEDLKDLLAMLGLLDAAKDRREIP